MLGAHALTLACALAAALPARAHAQDEPPPEDAAVPSTAAAAEAYDRGSAFYLNGDFVRAAQWFETAYRLAPAAPALIQALRAQVRTGHVIRAANLALRLRGLHGDDADARTLAEEVIRDNESDFVRLELRGCEGCQLEIEGRVWSYSAAFLTPHTDHDVLVTQGERREHHTVRGLPGQHVELGPPRAGEGPSDGASEGTTASPRAPSSAGLSPWFFAVGLGLTAVSGGLLIWSGVDTLDGVDAFDAMPTPEGFEEGQAKELRTNVLVGITAGLAVVTLLFAALTDWDGEPARPTAGVFFDGRAGGAWLRTAF